MCSRDVYKRQDIKTSQVRKYIFKIQELNPRPLSGYTGGTDQYIAVSYTHLKEIKDVDSVAGMISSGSSGISSMTSGGSSNEDKSSMYVLLKEKKKHTNKEIKKEILKKTKKFDCEVEVQELSLIHI